MEYTVKVPVKVTAASEAEALALAEKQYGHRPNKATLVEASLWPDALRPLAEKHGITPNGDRLRWGVVDGNPWVTDGRFAVMTPGVKYAGEPYPRIGEMPRGKHAKPARRLSYRLHYQIGDAILDRRYVDFVEVLHGECEWRGSTDLGEVVAFRDGQWVGVVMPLRDNPTIADARKRLRDAQFDAGRAADRLARADEIRGAVAALPAKEKTAQAARDACNKAERELSNTRYLAQQAESLDGAEALATEAAKTIAECEAELRSLGVKP